MADTIPNIIVLPDTVTNIYTDAGVVSAGVVVGDKITVAMLGQGDARLYTGATAPAAIDDDSGYISLIPGKSLPNDDGDSGAFIYSRLGCTINVSV